MFPNQFSIPGTQRTPTNHNADDEIPSDRAYHSVYPDKVVPCQLVVVYHICQPMASWMALKVILARLIKLNWSKATREQSIGCITGLILRRARESSFKNVNNRVVKEVSRFQRIVSWFLIHLFDQQILRDKLALFITTASLPYTIAENSHFQAVLNMTQIAPSVAHVKLPSDSTIPIDISRAYHGYEDRIRELFVDIPSFSYTVDAWTGEWRVPFLGITAHWIDKSWKQNSIVLGLELLEGSHTGVNMAVAFIRVLEHWNLQVKPFFLTADNASNMKTMATELELELGNDMFDSKENKESHVLK